MDPFAPWDPNKLPPPPEDEYGFKALTNFERVTSKCFFYLDDVLSWWAVSGLAIGVVLLLGAGISSTVEYPGPPLPRRTKILLLIGLYIAPLIVAYGIYAKRAFAIM
jgi:hypothetical protein